MSDRASMVGLLHAYSKQSPSAPSLPHVAGAPTGRASNALYISRHRRTYKLRAADAKALVEHYERHHNVAAAARELGITRQTAGKYLSAAGIATVRRISPADVAFAAEQYESGSSTATIGRRLGFDAQTIVAALRRAGVTIRARPGWPTS